MDDLFEEFRKELVEIKNDIIEFGFGFEYSNILFKFLIFIIRIQNDALNGKTDTIWMNNVIIAYQKVNVLNSINNSINFYFNNSNELKTEEKFYNHQENFKN